MPGPGFQPGNKHGHGRPLGSINGSKRAKKFMEEEGGIDLMIDIAKGTCKGKNRKFNTMWNIRKEVLIHLEERAYGKAPHSILDKDGEQKTIAEFLMSELGAPAKEKKPLALPPTPPPPQSSGQQPGVA